MLWCLFAPVSMGGICCVYPAVAATVCSQGCKLQARWVRVAIAQQLAVPGASKCLASVNPAGVGENIERGLAAAGCVQVCLSTWTPCSIVT